MSSPSDHDLWQREQEFLARERERVPELFTAPPRQPEELYLRIGILSFPKNLRKGYIKYSPLDFIVEEIRQDGRVIAADGQDSQPAPPSGCDGQGTVYADLVKVGISTLDASTRLAEALRLEAKQIGHAGIKDAVALTSQTISIRGTSLETVRSLQLPNILLKHVVEGKGAIQVGQLQGNRFTLFIRTEEEPDYRAIADQVGIVNAKGIPNYYGTQRFGFRFLSHLLGMYLARGEAKQAVLACFTKTNPFEPAYYQQIRNQVAKVFGDWKAVRKLIEPLPHTFRFEIAMLPALEKQNGEEAYAQALAINPKETEMWVKAYGSYLTNLALSEAEEAGRPLPETIQLFLSRDDATREFYGAWMQAHGTERFLENMQKLGLTSFINIGAAPTIPSRVWPKMYEMKALPEGVVMSFDLPKGAYATTVLMFFFDIVTGAPTPEWVKRIEVDTKTLLGTGSLSSVKMMFGDVLRKMMATKETRQETFV